MDSIKKYFFKIITDKKILFNTLLILFILILIVSYFLFIYCRENFFGHIFGISYHDDIKNDFIPSEVLTDYKIMKKNKNLLKKFTNFCKEYNIEYWAIGGTLLGAIREKGMIPWDDDSDIAITKENMNNILTYKNILKNKYDIGLTEYFFGYKIYDLKGIEINRNNLFYKHEKYNYPFIDLFVVVLDTDNNYIYEDEYTRSKWNEKFPISDVYPLKELDFEDFSILCPNNSVKLLNKLIPNWNISAYKSSWDHTKENFRNKTYTFDICYDKSKKPYLWLYWQNLNNKTPAYIDLCYKTVIKNCGNSFNIVRLNEDNIKNYLPELTKYEKYMKNFIIPHKVDIYRIMLLYKYGGLYLDSDIIVLKDLNEIIEKLKKYDFVGFGCTGDKCKYGYGKPSNWALAARPNSILFGKILEKLLDLIKEKYKNNTYKKEDYHSLGKFVIWQILNNLIKEDEYEYYHYPNTVDGTRTKDGKWVTNELIFSNQNINYDDENNMMFFTMYNSGVTDYFKNLDEDKIMTLDCNYTKYLKKALNKN